MNRIAKWETRIEECTYGAGEMPPVGPELSPLMLGGGIRPAHRYGLPVVFLMRIKFV